VASLFHFVPERMVGTVLYPLNALKDREPQLWRREVAKYKGREHVLEKSIPPLGCLWNDVLHFSVIHPSLVAGELKEVGIDLPRRRFFEIDADALDPGRTLIFLNRSPEGSHDSDESQWLPFDSARLVGLDQMSEATRRYYRESTALGQRPLLYRYLPHVLFRGQLETQGWPVHDV
jgi:hypothetical protein